MRTNDLVQKVEEAQVRMCYVGQSILARTGPAQYSKETKTLVSSMVEEAIPCLNRIRERIYQFINDNPELKLKSDYSVDKPMQNQRDNGEPKSAQHNILGILANVKETITKAVKDPAVSVSDNRKLSDMKEIQAEAKSFEQAVDKIIEAVLNDKQIIPQAVTVKEKTKTEEPATEEPATEEPATEEPATEEPATEEAVKQNGAEEGPIEEIK